MHDGPEVGVIHHPCCNDPTDPPAKTATAPAGDKMMPDRPGPNSIPAAADPKKTVRQNHGRYPNPPRPAGGSEHEHRATTGRMIRGETHPIAAGSETARMQ
jgi:hypothetical protein